MRKMNRMPAVVDTNVPIVANQASGAEIACAAACAVALHEITRTGVLVIDASDLIFNEYKNHLSFAGQPGVGDYFFKWLCDNRYRPDRVARVVLREDQVRAGEFAVFPEDPELSAFDRSDRKFVAAALSHPEKPPILNATDDDWWNNKEALERHGITVRFVCGVGIFQD